MNQSFDDSGLQFAFDSTSLGWAETCLRLYQYYMIERWRPIRNSVHLEFGGHYATALEHFHKHCAGGLSHDESLREVIRDTLVATWENDKPVEWDHPAKTRANLIRTIVWYCETFRDDPLQTLILPDGRPAVEYSFSLEIAPGILYSGHIDRLVTYGDQVYVQDQKTTQSTITQYWFNQFSPHTQMSGYTFAGRAIYDNPVKGVVIDGAQIAVGFSRFERGFTFRTDAQLDEWLTDTLYHIEQARAATARGYFPQNRSSCDKFGGCAFRAVCSRSPEVRQQFLLAEFRQGEGWDPLKRR